MNSQDLRRHKHIHANRRGRSEATEEPELGRGVPPWKLVPGGRFQPPSDSKDPTQFLLGARKFLSSMDWPLQVREREDQYGWQRLQRCLMRHWLR